MGYLLRCLLVLGIAWPNVASALTEAECAEIQERYGATGPGCAVPDTDRAVLEALRTARNETDRTLIEAGLTLEQIQDNVFFPSGGHAIDDVAGDRIREVANVLNTGPLEDACLQLVGHSDNSGSEDTNLEIGLKRAEAVANELTASIDRSRIASIVSQGEWQPISNLSGESRYQRRVEFRLRRCP